MPDNEETKATIVKSFSDLIERLNSDYTILKNINVYGMSVASTDLLSLGLFKKGTLKTYICVKNDSVEILYQRISKLVLSVVQEVSHEVI
ncbi:MAG: hypothetical protein UIB61_05070 [Treponema sp.]|nr:hypothetical protein [Treponema sp.]